MFQNKEIENTFLEYFKSRIVPQQFLSYVCYVQGLIPKPFDGLGCLSVDFNGDGIPNVPWAGIPCWDRLPVVQ